MMRFANCRNGPTRIASRLKIVNKRGKKVSNPGSHRVKASKAVRRVSRRGNQANLKTSRVKTDSKALAKALVKTVKAVVRMIKVLAMRAAVAKMVGRLLSGNRPCVKNFVGSVKAYQILKGTQAKSQRMP